MSTTIDCPQENKTATVVVQGSGTTGYISASGEAISDSSADDEAAVWDVFSSVFALVYPGFKDSSSADVPMQHDPTAGSVPQSGTGGTSEWYFAKVFGAVCNTTGSGPLCTLVVWAKFPRIAQEVRAFRHFHGVCGSTTSCPPPGSGNEQSLEEARGGQREPGTLALSTAPRDWRVVVGGFSGGEGQAFNGSWLLHLRGTVRGLCFWENTGNGVAAPLVRLSCESPIASIWRLTFRLARTRFATRRAAAWNLLGRNVLTLSPDETTGDIAPPPSLAVTPQ